MVSNDNAGMRYDWWEDEIYEEKLDPKGGKFDRLNTFFKDHEKRTDNAIGRVVNKRLDNGQIKADVIFGSDEDATKIFNKYVEGILTDVSIGYSINEVQTTKRKDEPTEVLVVDFDIRELSAVWAGFDSKAKIGRGLDEVTEKKETVQRSKRMQRINKIIQISR
jgi:hypothetical protein